jgi:hypothetical protein
MVARPSPRVQSSLWQHLEKPILFKLGYDGKPACARNIGIDLPGWLDAEKLCRFLGGCNRQGTPRRFDGLANGLIARAPSLKLWRSLNAVLLIKSDLQHRTRVKIIYAMFELPNFRQF